MKYTAGLLHKKKNKDLDLDKELIHYEWVIHPKNECSKAKKENSCVFE